MIDFEIVQEKQLYFTKGLKKKYGYEFEIVLDDLTVKRVGMSAARNWFERFLIVVRDKKVEPNLVIENFTFYPEWLNKPLEEGEIRPLHIMEVVLKPSIKRYRVEYLRIVYSDFRGKLPWEKDFKGVREQMLGLFTLFDILNILNDYFTPNTKDFYDYVLWTSDDHTSFLRTCYKQKSKCLPNGKIAKSVTHVVVAFTHLFEAKGLIIKPWEIDQRVLRTNIKLQVCFTNEDIEPEIELNRELGFGYCYVLNLLSGEVKPYDSE